MNMYVAQKLLQTFKILLIMNTQETIVQLKELKLKGMVGYSQIRMIFGKKMK